ncbi:SurA-like protein [Ruminiclostridium sufflavum DSM 19573]|uniref:peptidylprolyl isomerase n=1 Tax=Ruminiclostridium sufflavum DSM 19573 TaxID=1121337 RepID=A0A318XNG7_9FIRM|nr:peptidylprolyl isomerase [Ruminiclostridium sufflavum]PYG88266.1 SurA-like protein [Ruminiclostridium sufflavum DSM 19573]
MENENVKENANVNEDAIENTNEEAVADTSTDANEIAKEAEKENLKEPAKKPKKADKKKKSKGFVIGVTAAALVVIAVAAVLFIFKPWSAGYVATVDKQKITEQEYKVISKVNMQQFLASAGVDSSTTVENYDWNQQKNGEAIKEQIQKETLDQLQENKIMLTKAGEAGIKLSKEDISNIDSTITSQYGSEEAAKGSIESTYGVTLEEFKEFYKGLVLQQNYFSSEQSNSKIAVTDEEVQKYYDDNQDLFDQATISHIVISTLDSNGASVSEGKKAELKKQADNVVTQIKAGKDMKTLATENNSSTSEDNIEITFLNGELSSQYSVLEALEKWTFSNDEGTIGIVEASYGYDVVRIEKRGIKAFEEVKDQINSNLKYTKFSEEFNKKLEGWKKDKQFEVVKNGTVLDKLNLELYGK